MFTTRTLPSASLLFALLIGTVFTPVAARAQVGQQYYDPIAIAALKRKITQAEAQVKALEAVIADRRRQLDEAPAIVRPVQAQKAEAEKKYEAARIAANRINDALREANTGLIRLKKQLEESVKQKPAYKAAQAEMEKTKADADRLRAAADERLRDESDYRRLVQTEALYQERLDAAKEKQQVGQVSPEEYLRAIKEFETAQTKRQAYLEKQLEQDPAYQHAFKLYEKANAAFESVSTELRDKALSDPTITEFEKTIAQVKKQQKDAIQFTAAAKREVFALNAKLARMKRQADTFIAALNKVIRDRDILDRKVNGMVSRLRYLESLPPRPVGQ